MEEKQEIKINTQMYYQNIPCYIISIIDEYSSVIEIATGSDCYDVPTEDGYESEPEIVMSRFIVNNKFLTINSINIPKELENLNKKILKANREAKKIIQDAEAKAKRIIQEANKEAEENLEFVREHKDLIELLKIDVNKYKFAVRYSSDNPIINIDKLTNIVYESRLQFQKDINTKKFKVNNYKKRFNCDKKIEFVAKLTTSSYGDPVTISAIFQTEKEAISYLDEENSLSILSMQESYNKEHLIQEYDTRWKNAEKYNLEKTKNAIKEHNIKVKEFKKEKLIKELEIKKKEVERLEQEW
jgi:vacuolar-type H+-ATPase subunit H